MNWLPRRKYNGIVTARKMRLIAITSFQCFRHQRRTGRYRAWVIRAAGLRDSGRRLPLTNKGMSAGTSVIDNNDEKTKARVFVHASGRNIRPSCASSRKTGRNETTIMMSE